jgi:hypothetical protein
VGCLCRLVPSVPMVEPAQPRHRDHLRIHSRPLFHLALSGGNFRSTARPARFARVPAHSMASCWRSQNFQGSICSGAEEGAHGSQEGEQELKHELTVVTWRNGCRLAISRNSLRYLSTHSPTPESSAAEDASDRLHRSRALRRRLPRSRAQWQPATALAQSRNAGNPRPVWSFKKIEPPLRPGDDLAV